MTQAQLEYTIAEAIKNDIKRNMELCDELQLTKLADIMRVTDAALQSIYPDDITNRQPQ